ncbi:N-acetyltransferase [Kutzneria buriramensis]|uniref:Acetyltransferase (GNAT) family protein n=1 Tax=Kutzneria buriramensis TaxID=1045776 RepID=A0A3E0HLP7_9PSEU|nr:GNAT family N-acetyltransferase [Kutzneria buriramensis]REH47361.1 acetyltransferase (GNAT) family protein [Kutzneria buriramensis]
MRLHVADAAVQGVIEVTEDRAAVAVWMTVDDSVPPAADDYADQLRDACGPYTAHFEDLEATFAEHHPSGKRHHHLAFLAAMPGAQGRGAGTALLRHHFQTYPDWDAYLEASSIESARLYRRHGFEEIGPFVVGGGPTFWPMWRPASS